MEHGGGHRKVEWAKCSGAQHREVKSLPDEVSWGGSNPARKAGIFPVKKVEEVDFRSSMCRGTKHPGVSREE